MHSFFLSTLIIIKNTNNIESYKMSHCSKTNKSSAQLDAYVSAAVA